MGNVMPPPAYTRVEQRDEETPIDVANSTGRFARAQPPNVADCPGCRADRALEALVDAHEQYAVSDVGDWAPAPHHPGAVEADG
jgi:hypothetical protein